MAVTGTRIAFVAYNAARQCFEGAVEFFTPGLPIPLRVGVELPAAPSLEHHALVRGLVRAAEREILR